MKHFLWYTKHIMPCIRDAFYPTFKAMHILCIYTSHASFDWFFECILIFIMFIKDRLVNACYKYQKFHPQQEKVPPGCPQYALHASCMHHALHSLCIQWIIHFMHQALSYTSCGYYTGMLLSAIYSWNWLRTDQPTLLPVELLSQLKIKEKYVICLLKKNVICFIQLWFYQFWF